ncbi:MAG TPA: hypothetical protein VM285_06905 [Polyangia bacterium]|nr:hypothetical protein [Polyangia bacterium]
MRATKMVLLVSLLAWGCGDGTSTTSFESGPCKKEVAAEQAAVPVFLLTPWNGDDLMGLTCIAWAPGTETGDVGLDLLSFPGACGAEWQGEGSIDGVDIELRVYNLGCMLAGCGTCIYDWSFGLHDVEDAASISLGIEVDQCPGEGESETCSATLPGPLSAAGIVCRWTDAGALEWHAGEAGTCGALHMPCGDSEICGELDPGQCLGDLQCADRGDGAEVCLALCIEDADCLPAGMMSCGDDNLCRLDEGW